VSTLYAQAVRSREPATGELEIGFDGSMRWLQMDIIPELNERGELLSLLQVAWDITEHKALETALRQERAFIGRITDMMPLMVYVFDRESGKSKGRALFANAALERFMGVSPGAWHLLTDADFVARLHPDDLPLWTDYLEEVITRSSDLIQPVELRLRRADGDMRWMRFWVTLFDQADTRQREQLLALILDITGEMKTQQVLVEAERAQAQLEAEQTLLLLKNRMMIRVADQFRNPLAAILSATELLSTYNERMNAEQRAARFAQIRDQVRHLTKLLDDMNLVLRGHSSERPVELFPIDLGEFCRQQLGAIHTEMGGQHQVMLVIQGDTKAVLVDPDLLVLILEHLLQNAFLYTPASGQVTLEVEVSDMIRLTVRDSGIGIHPEDQPRIFEPFFRGRNIDERPGLGLGLPIVRDAVTAYRGSMMVESALGAGTVVTVSLPLAAPIPPALESGSADALEAV
jgi:signal transduction histidine kinase